MPVITPSWLGKHTPREWIRAALAELRLAEESYTQQNVRAGLAGARRAAGMALNGALCVEPRPAWGRSYVDHLLALSKDAAVPERVRAAAKILIETPLQQPGGLVMLRVGRADSRAEKILEAARDVAAHALAVVLRNETPEGKA